MREKTQIERPKFSKPKEYKPRKLTQTQKFQAQMQKIKHKNTRKSNPEHTSTNPNGGSKWAQKADSCGQT